MQELDPYSRLWRGDTVPLRQINNEIKYTRPAVLCLFKAGKIVAQIGFNHQLYLSIPSRFRDYGATNLTAPTALNPKQKSLFRPLKKKLDKS